MKIINLLPKTQQTELRYQAMLHRFWGVLGLSLVSFALVFLAQFAAKIYLQIEAKVYISEIADLQGQVSKQDNTEIKGKIKQINDTVTDYKTLADSSPKLSKAIAAFAELPPPGIKINSISLDAARKVINVNGQGATREAIIQLYNNIHESKNFYNVDYPLENVVKPSNQTFHFTFYIQDILIK